MIQLSGDDIKWVAATLKQHMADHTNDLSPIDWSDHYGRTYVYEGDVVPKERPRMGKSGKMYTPKETREFESKLAAWGELMGMDGVPFPLKVTLNIYEPTDDPALRMQSLMGLTYNDKGDLDNLVKAILDGLNKIAWKDDKQIVKLHAARRWSRRSGFMLTLERAGLSPSEYKRVLRVMNRAP